MKNEHAAPQFIASSPGWLALFEYEEEGEFVIHAEPVIAWCLRADEGSAPRGTAVVGANPWVRNTEEEDASHLFALVHEEQLEPEFLEELKATRHRSREAIVERALACRSDRKDGHGAWVRERRRSPRGAVR